VILESIENSCAVSRLCFKESDSRLGANLAVLESLLPCIELFLTLALLDW
jgi:hypothetical protein